MDYLEIKLEINSKIEKLKNNYDFYKNLIEQRKSNEDFLYGIGI